MFVRVVLQICGVVISFIRGSHTTDASHTLLMLIVRLCAQYRWLRRFQTEADTAVDSRRNAAMSPKHSVVDKWVVVVITHKVSSEDDVCQVFITSTRVRDGESHRAAAQRTRSTFLMNPPSWLRTPTI